MEPIIFTKWNGLNEYSMRTTGCNLYSGVGICRKNHNKTSILRSVDNTLCYDDDLMDINNPQYTLFGHYGDQDINEPKYNEPLLNTNKTEHIYLYRVRMNGKKKEWLWYGKYEIENYYRKFHPGKDNIMRRIIMLSLRKID
jgi:hypothetical protein